MRRSNPSGTRRRRERRGHTALVLLFSASWPAELRLDWLQMMSSSQSSGSVYKQAPSRPLWVFPHTTIKSNRPIHSSAHQRTQPNAPHPTASQLTQGGVAIESKEQASIRLNHPASSRCPPQPSPPLLHCPHQSAAASITSPRSPINEPRSS